MDSLPIVLPTPPAPLKRPSLPLAAAVVPVVGGVVIWLVTGSLISLCFAALGPLMVLASLVDGIRVRRRDRRRTAAETEAAWERAESDLVLRSEEERERRWEQLPDAARCHVQPPLRSAQAPDASTALVIGRGRAASGFRTTGGDDDRARRFQVRSAVLDGAPITVPLGGGLCLRGPEVVVSAAVRALLVQLCLRFSPAVLVVSGDTETHGLSGFPHLRGARRGALRLAIAGPGAPRSPADATIWTLPEGSDVPEGVTTVIDCTEPRRAALRTPQGTQEIEIECLSETQTSTIAAQCGARVDDVEVLPEVVRLEELSQRSSGGMTAVIGRSERADVAVDLVDDGPHAIVTGTTGTGKSELLISWVTAIASAYGPEEVMFVLADFKGGTAFEPLRELPQVAAVITDLDETGAHRGVTSLTAELRRREGVLAAAGARDIRDVAMPRLVIVVDEFAALLQEHPDLGAVFVDIAARGRALGMHLILGTQRAAGVIREALAANCPLRISLRVGDPADSRLVLGTDAAAELPGGASSRGLALVRRPQDPDAVPFRVALTGAADLRGAGLRFAGSRVLPGPWLPPLPRMLPLAALSGAVGAGALALGLADAPERQEQPVEVLRAGDDRGLAVVGGPGTGKSGVVRLLAAQHPGAIVIPEDPEQAWDAVITLSEKAPMAQELILCDDLDRQITGLPAEHAQHLIQRWERILRAGAGRTVVLTTGRASGPVSRLLDGLPSRALLRLPSRVEHLAAGGEASSFHRDRPPGRACIADRELQFAWIDEDAGVTGPSEGSVPTADGWEPTAAVSAMVTSGGVRAVVSALADAHPACEVLAVGGEPAGDRPHIWVGDAESWQRAYPLWQSVRAEGEILVRAECAPELRQLAGVRELPPYALPHAGRAWSIAGGRPPRRVVIGALVP